MSAEKMAVAEEVLAELLKEGLIPFKLTVGSLKHEGDSRYRVYFYDSRFHAVWFFCDEDGSFREKFRAAVLKSSAVR